MVAPYLRFGMIFALMAARVCWAAPESAARPLPKIVLFFHDPPQQIDHLHSVEKELTQSKRYRIVLLRALTPLMRQADAKEQMEQRSSDLVAEGRKALVVLDHDLAQAKLSEAQELLRKSFIPYYDPRVLAQVHLEIGRLALQRARPDQARQAFVKVHQLDTTLKLDAHYSPQVRNAFSDAAINLPPRPVPPAEDLARIAALAEAKLILVLSVEDAGGNQRLLKGSLYQAEKGSYTAVESRMIDVADPTAARQQSKDLGSQLRIMMDSHFPAPKPLAKIRKPPATQPALPPPPPLPTPWYLKWYTFVAAGAVVAAAIVVPLALREEHVDLTVTLPSPAK